MSSDPNRYLAFSGGGFNTHSMLAGMLAGTLDGLDNERQVRDVSLLTREIDGISANSGGSWFLTQLAFSPEFINQFESSTTADKYNTTGYNGQIYDIYQNKPPETADQKTTAKLLSASSFETIQAWFSLLGKTGFDWRAFNEDIVFAPFGMTEILTNAKFNDPRQNEWATHKDIIVASSMQASPTVLDSIGILDDTLFAKASSSTIPAEAQVFPLTFTSNFKSDQSTFEASASIPAGPNKIFYSASALVDEPKPVDFPIDTQFEASDLSVLDVSAASSSALGLLASPTSYKSILSNELENLSSGIINQLANGLRDLAPLATFSDEKISMPATLPDNSSVESQFEEFATSGFLRLADGAYVDNTSAAHMVKEIQASNSIDKSFTLTIFSNSSSSISDGIKMETGNGESSDFTVTKEIAALFGNSNGQNNDGNIVNNTTLFNQNSPSPHVFDDEAWEGVKPEWTYVNGTFDISLYKLNVTTLENNAFGVKQGQSGEVDVYITRNSDSASAPTGSQTLTAYQDNYNFFRDALNKSGGAKYLLDSFGVEDNNVSQYEGANKNQLISVANTTLAGSSDASGRQIDLKYNAKHRFTRNRSKNANERLIGSQQDDVILHSSKRTIATGNDGSDLHIIVHKKRPAKHKRSKITDFKFDDGDRLLLEKSSFGKSITYERAFSNLQRKRFQRSEADFVYVVPESAGGEALKTGKLFYNQNGAEPGWGAEGGHYLTLGGGIDLPLDGLAMI